MYVRVRVYCSRVRLIGNYLQVRNDVARSFSRENQSERRNGGAGTLQFNSQRKYIILLAPHGPVRRAAVTRTAISTPAQIDTVGVLPLQLIFLFIYLYPIRHNNITVFLYS